jgi:hypothetical protein
MIGPNDANGEDRRAMARELEQIADLLDSARARAGRICHEGIAELCAEKCAARCRRAACAAREKDWGWAAGTRPQIVPAAE